MFFTNVCAALTMAKSCISCFKISEMTLFRFQNWWKFWPAVFQPYAWVIFGHHILPLWNIF